MTEHQRKMVAPVVVSVLVIVYYVFYFGILIALLSGIWRWLLALVPAVIAVVMIAVCIDRIREIQRGEEDDLSKY